MEDKEGIELVFTKLFQDLYVEDHVVDESVLDHWLSEK